MPEAGPQWVRTFTAEDVLREAREMATVVRNAIKKAENSDEEQQKRKNVLKAIEGRRFAALVDLRDAINDHNDERKKRASETLDRIHRDAVRAEKELPAIPGAEAYEQQMAVYLSPLVRLPSQEAREHFRGKRTGPKAKEDHSRLFAYELACNVGLGPQFVHWIRKGSDALEPAVYCPFPDVARYLYTFYIEPNKIAVCGLQSCQKMFVRRKFDQR